MDVSQCKLPLVVQVEEVIALISALNVRLRLLGQDRKLFVGVDIPLREISQD